MNGILTVSPYNMYAHCTLHISICIARCVQWIFDIRHYIHAFVLIALPSSTSILRDRTVHSYCICANVMFSSCNIAYWIECVWVNEYGYFLSLSVSFDFNQCQFFNDYFHFNSHSDYFLFSSSFSNLLLPIR